MKLDLRGLLAGERLLTFSYEEALDIDPDDTASILHGTSFPSPMKVEGEITNTAGYMRLTLTMTVDYHSFCARCLTPVFGTFSLDLEKTVAPKKLLIDVTEDRRDDYVIIEDGFIELNEAICDQLEIEFPYRFLCKEDCLGLCPRCGTNLNEEKCSCELKEKDPRIAGPLERLLEEMKKNNNN